MRDEAFRAYFERHHASLSRLAYLMTGESDVADDLAADALTECWRHWDRVTTADDPAAYGHGILMNLARQWIRRRGRDRLLSFESLRRTKESDVSAVLDVRGALRRLPHRRRACVVLRYAFDLPEREVATILGISVGAVKSSTSRGAKQLAELLGGSGVARIDGWEAAR
ncbi:RNA polymerase sigma-70 factor (sigma-E family) [Actinoplanes lutulentus]|uniref:RNA polymerase sigma-70 factor (Sigma-E family) n=1 Tax=Actinoplanes lutulentus TaxID=1287878 RepID=A0A327ZCJ1_9ACTN|nr:SigE family RNA polymerase sigma factor [Actinoplanes lutulentus]MBB2942535.1 RNA polymerase sigma-70 factor (sigma-E family) [Actinoplanes lutulentus]RAK38116.1 RNA polymerase sigma-70 factor (sigma-E family) [Actinoplanes lutulentus]